MRVGGAVSRWACWAQAPPLAGVVVAGLGCGGGTQLDNSKRVPPPNIPVTLGGVGSSLHHTSSPIRLRLLTWKAGTVNQETDI